PSAWITIGRPAGEFRGLCVASAGWNSFLGSVPPPAGFHGPDNPFSAAFASTLAAAAVFQQVFLNKPLVHQGLDISLLHFGDDITSSRATALYECDVGTLSIVGLGAVANGAIWALARHPALRGSVSLIDGETVELSNLQRYVLTTDSDVGQSKTTLASRAL